MMTETTSTQMHLRHLQYGKVWNKAAKGNTHGRFANHDQMQCHMLYGGTVPSISYTDGR